MHVTFNREFAATPAYIDPPMDHAGRDVDGNSLDLLQDLYTFHNWLFMGAAVLPIAPCRRVKRDLCVGHASFFTVKSL